MREKQFMQYNDSFRVLLKSKGITLKDISKRFACNPSTITRMFQDEDNLTIKQIRELLNMINCTFEWHIMNK